MLIYVYIITKALAVALKEASSPEFSKYIRQVVNNAKALANALMKRGYRVVTDGLLSHYLFFPL
jgi:glycine hydroxymethyltransferase